MTERNDEPARVAPETPAEEQADHRLAVVEGLTLPYAALLTLQAGIPPLLRIPYWPGPCIFQSELGSGTLQSTAAEDALIRRSGQREGYVLGSVRQGPKTPPISAFVLRKTVGDVHLIDAGNETLDCFANSSLDTFLASLLAFHGAFDHLLGVSEDREKHVESFRQLLTKIDAPCLESPDHYWPGWLEAMK